MNEILWFFGGFAVGVGCSAAIYLFSHRLAAARYMSEKGTRAVQAKQEYEDRMTAALVEAAALHKAGKKPQEIMAELLPRYPDVAMRLVKKLGKGQGLEGLI